jgi:hypothetical protein
MKHIASSHQIFQKCLNFLIYCVGINIFFEKFDGNLQYVLNSDKYDSSHNYNTNN